MKQAHETLKAQEDEMFQKYLNHCVVMIQKTWRGHYIRNQIMPQTIRKYKAMRVFTAGIQGWKIRRIMSGTREVINIKREMAEIGFDLRRALGITNHQAQARQIQLLKNRKTKKVDELVRAI
jgi:myosin heavy subunit